MQQVIDMAQRDGDRHVASFEPGRSSTTLGTQRRAPARDGAGLLGVRRTTACCSAPTFVTKIVGPNGKVLYQNADTRAPRARRQQVARTETEMLTGVLKSGTGERALGNFDRPAAGKTGTTDDNVDAWFVGLHAAVSPPRCGWAIPNGETPMTNVGGIAVFGATYPGRDLGARS